MNRHKCKIVITCEHGGNEIPAAYANLFDGAEEVLNTHRGYDLGALELYKRFASNSDFAHHSTTSRLLVELNRSLHHPKLFSEFTQALQPKEKEQILKAYYQPYRQQIEQKLTHWVAQGEVILHLSVHSFTPVFDNKVRNADVGLLYDPSREREQLFSAHWRKQFQQRAPWAKVRYNYPYKGTADGFVTHLRKLFPAAHYAGIELEVNQKFPVQEPVLWQDLQRALVESFWQAL
ncbi:MAG: N-formylglutamate amidohydrolase [Rufibacter sp.]